MTIPLEQIVHPERVGWYRTLIEEMTQQTPQVMLVGDLIAVWVGPYHSTCGLLHPSSTQVWATTVEQALAELCEQVYADTQADFRALQASSVGLVRA
jgi:UDP-2,3-diacylglucosamine pyrophosphatase LpxH